jgi:hypothetical protein
VLTTLWIVWQEKEKFELPATWAGIPLTHLTRRGGAAECMGMDARTLGNSVLVHTCFLIHFEFWLLEDLVWQLKHQVEV